MKTNASMFDVLTAIIGGIGLTIEPLSMATEIVYLVMLIVGILSALVGLVIKVKRYFADGKLTDEELEDIRKDLEKLSNEVKKHE